MFGLFSIDRDNVIDLVPVEGDDGIIYVTLDEAEDDRIACEYDDRMHDTGRINGHRDSDYWE